MDKTNQKIFPILPSRRKSRIHEPMGYREMQSHKKDGKTIGEEREKGKWTVRQNTSEQTKQSRKTQVDRSTDNLGRSQRESESCIHKYNDYKDRYTDRQAYRSVCGSDRDGQTGSFLNTPCHAHCPQQHDTDYGLKYFSTQSTSNHQSSNSLPPDLL